MVTVVFYIFAVAAVLGGLMCILQRSPVASAIWLMSTMFSLAAIFVLLGAQLIGILQILVYVGAILVLFLFVIMLLNLSHGTADFRGPPAIASAVVIAGLLLIELAAVWHYTPERLAAEFARLPAAPPEAVFPQAAAAAQATAQSGVVGALAAPLFQIYLVPFEITSILLLAALVGAVVLAKRKV
jgi:NADH-quinone oxidoreductase subunit J